VQRFGWHVQLQLDGRDLPQHEVRLKGLPCKLVVDHVGKFGQPGTTPEHAGFKVLLRLLDTGNCWVKLSAPYETSKIGPPHYDDVAALARALAKANPERCLWASNWPHPNVRPSPDEAALLAWARGMVADDHRWRQVLVDNPAQLYGFDSPAREP